VHFARLEGPLPWHPESDNARAAAAALRLAAARRGGPSGACPPSRPGPPAGARARGFAGAGESLATQFAWMRNRPSHGCLRLFPAGTEPQALRLVTGKQTGSAQVVTVKRLSDLDSESELLTQLYRQAVLSQYPQ
jgi:hypothetical protein